MKTTFKVIAAIFALVGIFLTWLIWPVLHGVWYIFRSAPRIIILLALAGAFGYLHQLPFPDMTVPAVGGTMCIIGFISIMYGMTEFKLAAILFGIFMIGAPMVAGCTYADWHKGCNKNVCQVHQP